MQELKDCTCGVELDENNITVIGITDGADLGMDGQNIIWYTCNICGSSHIYTENQTKVA